jgi:predicted site-specific integrase-resolvase
MPPSVPPNPSADIENARLRKPEEVALYLGVSLDTLARWRVQGSGPAFVKFHRAKQGIIRYRREDLERFVAEHTRTATA